MKKLFLLITLMVTASFGQVVDIANNARVKDFPSLVNANINYLNANKQDALGYVPLNPGTSNDWLQISTPGSNPSAGHIRVYAKTSGGVCWVTSLGVETCPTNGSSPSWGAIGGTLSAQTDLQTAFNAKQNALGFTAENVAAKGAVSGYAGLDSGAHILDVNLPADAVTTGTLNGGTLAGSVASLSIGAKALILGGALTTSGNFGVTITVSGTTSISLPTTGALLSAAIANDWTAISTPGSNPASGKYRVYAKTGSGVCWLDSGGVEGCAGSGGGTWGSITGTLSSQSDLQTAFNAKQNTLGFTAENSANKGAANGYAGLDGSMLVPLAQLPSIPFSQTTGIQAALGYTPQNVTGKGAASGYAGLDSSSLLQATNFPAFSGDITKASGSLATVVIKINGTLLSGLTTGLLKNTTSTGVPSIAVSADVIAALGYTPETTTKRNAVNGYAPLDASGLLPDLNLPADVVTNTTIGAGSIAANFASITSTGNITVTAGTITASGNIYANNGSTAAGCLHLADTNTVHDTGFCAPGSGVNRLWVLPTTNDTDGYALIPDGSGNLKWANTFVLPSATGYASFAAVAGSSGSPTAFTITTPAHTGLATTAEDNQILFDMSSTMTWVAGAITTQRAMLIKAPTIAFATGSNVVSTASVMAISGPPIGGTNATISGAYGLYVQGGATANATLAAGARFDQPTGGTKNFAALLNGTTSVGISSGSSVIAGSTLFVYNNSGAGSTTVNLQAAAAPQAGNILAVYESTGATVYARIDKNFGVGATALYGMNVSAVTITCGTGAGSPTPPAGGACAISGNDIGGQITIATTATPITGTVATITFGNTHTSAPAACSLTAANATTSALSLANKPFVDTIGATTFTFKTSGSGVLAQPATYSWWYACQG